MRRERISALEAAERMLATYFLPFAPGCPFFLKDVIVEEIMQSGAPRRSDILENLALQIPGADIVKAPPNSFVPTSSKINCGAFGIVLAQGDGGAGRNSADYAVVVLGERIWVMRVYKSWCVFGVQATEEVAGPWMAVVGDVLQKGDVQRIGGTGEVRVSICGALSEY